MVKIGHHTRLDTNLLLFMVLDHAQTLAIIVPALMQHQKANKREKLIQFAQRVWNYQGDEEQAIQVSTEKTRQFFEQMGVKHVFLIM
ncbi:hypothetical protein AAUPMB_01594, partial [Pasteurella multocida subsp. multocida str. Anand1_buffalo]